MAAITRRDPTSRACPDLCAVTKIHLDLSIDFSKHVLAGNAVITAERRSDSAEYLILDTKTLRVERITCANTGEEVQFSLCDAHPVFGTKLEIKLPAQQGKEFKFNIAYETSPQCSALQWLSAEQTAGNRHPYLFSQCQAIHARSLLPCQDTPGVKFTYTARISAPRELVVLMSAIKKETEAVKDDASRLAHTFVQNVPISSYLLAIVAGDLESRDIGPRSKVWSEKELVDRAAFDFSETEQMLQTAESIVGPYVWGRYDLLVLPPSFPFGGMENPCLTFVTPTLLAGDKSLANVVAHEIAHSWTGNLVTNKTNEDFWLNEGHTVCLERKICAKIAGGGEPLRQFKAIGGWKELINAVEGFGLDHPYTRLVPDLTDVDPDECFSPVPYEKGFTLLFFLETLVGGPEVFDKFLRAYIEKFKYQAITHHDWKDFFLSYFHSEAQNGVFDCVDWNAWFYGTGMPPVKPNYDDSVGVPCQQLCQRWATASEAELVSFSAADWEALSTLQRIEFLSRLLMEEPLPVTKMVAMEKVYNLNSITNSEIRFRWLRLGLRAHWSEAIPRAIDMVTEQGRLKFTRPLYKDLYDWEESRQAAINNFLAHRGEMHSTTAQLVARQLQVQ